MVTLNILVGHVIGAVSEGVIVAMKSQGVGVCYFFYHGAKSMSSS